MRSPVTITVQSADQSVVTANSAGLANGNSAALMGNTPAALSISPTLLASAVINSGLLSAKSMAVTNAGSSSGIPIQVFNQSRLKV